MTAGRPGVSPPKRVGWVQLVVGLLALWATTWLVTSWLDMRPDLLALAAVIFSAGASIYFAILAFELLGVQAWPNRALGRRVPLTHGRLGALRRLSEDATRRTGSGEPVPGAYAYQRVLRSLTASRLESRLGHPPSDRDLAGVDPGLAAYLAADDPPVLSTAEQSRLIDRIEEI